MTPIELFRLLSTVPAFEKRYLRWTVNRPYRGLVTKLIANPHQYPPRSMRHATRNGIAYDFDLSDLVGWYYYWGFLDPSIDGLKALVKPGMTYLDVGANIGVSCLQVERLVGPGGRVVAFEPDPVNYAHLCRNIALNGSRIDARHMGLADRPGLAHLETPNVHNRSSNRIGDTGQPISLSTLDLETATLDRLDLIKIDVEGYEIQVINGGRETLERFRPLLYVECIDQHLRHGGGSAPELIALLQAAGYRVQGPDGTELSPEAGRGSDFDVTCVPR